MKSVCIFALKFAKGLADLGLALFLFMPVFVFYLLPMALSVRLDRGRQRGNHGQPPRRAMYLQHGGLSLDMIQRKGNAEEIVRERTVGGYFEKALVCRFATPRNARGAFGTSVEIHEMRQWWLFRWVALVGYLVKCARLARRDNMTLLRSLDPYWAGMAAYLLGWTLNIPFCISIHTDFDLTNKLSDGANGPYFLGSRRLAKFCERRVFRRTPFVLPISGYVAKYCVRNGARPESIRIIPHGVNADASVSEPDAETRARYIRPGKANVLFVGRLHKEKYAMDTVEIGAALRRRGVPFHFILCGDGPRRGDLERAIVSRNLQSDFTLAGFVPLPQLVKIMKSVDAHVCLLSGYALIEAALSGKPIVAYRVEWHDEFIRNGENGLLVDEHDADAAAAAMERIHRDPAFAARLAENARRDAMAHYSLHRTLEIKRDVMDEIYTAFYRTAPL